MPTVTGYTSYIYENKANTLEDFIKVCVSAFSYDRPIDMKTALLPKETKVDSYILERLENALKELTEFENMSYEERLDLFNREVNDNIQSVHKYLEEKRDFNKKLTNMIEQIEAWKVPDELKELKKFMNDQCKLCIDTDESYSKQQIDHWTKLKYSEWVKSKFDQLMQNYDYAEEDLEKAVDAIKKYNRWISKVKRYIPKKKLDMEDFI